jgi:lysophospholipase L1-like esterase
MKREGARQAALTAALLAGTALACLLLAEVALRFFPGFDPLPRVDPGERANRPHQAFAPDPELGWRMRPNIRHERDTDEFHVVYASNAQGFRAAADFDVAETRRLIAVVGDSVTFGQGVALEQTWGARVAAGLPQAVAYNFAMPGFGIDQMWLAVRSQALPRHPDLVIVAFINDDFARSLSAWRADLGMAKPSFVVEDGALRPAPVDDRPAAPRRFVEDHSQVWALARRVGRLIALRLPVGEWWTLNAALLDAIRADCDTAGTPVLFVYLPGKGARAFPTLSTHMRRTGAAFLDLGQPGTAPDGLHFETDRHPNVRGHRWIADRVLEWIRAERPELATPPAR